VSDESLAPRRYLGVMVSSTFRYLESHRAALMRAIEAHGLHAVAMEQDAALPGGTVIDSSLLKVRDAAAYIGVIGFRYGQIPDSAEGNPERLSLTELEFREARRLGRPMLIFIMGPEHDVKLGAVEQDPEKFRKLEAFRDEAKRATAGSRVERVYKEFNSLREFEVAAMQSVAELRRSLDQQHQAAAALSPGSSAESGAGDGGGIPRPPELYAEPRYIGSHEFVGRTAELETLDDWAGPSDRHPVLLFTAIGGTGKSMLTWEWTARHAERVRSDWAGLMWYSFYDKGAVMADFCRRALAYMTGRPLDDFRKMRQPELTGRLLQQLAARPWLLVLDGLERILVAYHRHDAAQVADEDAGRDDQIARRDPCAAIRPHDDDLLRGLAAAAPSKVLVTSRLMPHALLNPSGRPLPGVRHEHLPGLRPADAEALLRSCGIHGDSRLIRDYLHRHCDCHPLVTGIVAGLVSDYLPDRGNFGAWAVDPAEGGKLNLADLDLVAKRNHILRAALDALPDKVRQLLSTLALLSEAVDYDTLTALNPHLPPQPEPPRRQLPADLDPDDLPAELRRQRESRSEADRERRLEYERDRRSWLASPDVQAAPRELARSVRDLERRGLLQYDRQAGRYDLHPVVRGYAAGRLGADDRDRLGQRAVDYFNQRPRTPYEQAETLDDVHAGLQLVKTLLQIGRPKAACRTYTLGLSTALLVNLEASAEILSLLRPFFTQDWAALSASADNLDHYLCTALATDAGLALGEIGQLQQSLTLHELAAKMNLTRKVMVNLRVNLQNMASVFARQNRLAISEKGSLLALELAESMRSDEALFSARLERFNLLTELGWWADAEAIWHALDPMGRAWQRAFYCPGDAEASYARARFWQGSLTDEVLGRAEDLARSGHNRPAVRALHALRGAWQLQRGEWAPAQDSLHEAIRMTREAGISDTELETQLALARFHLGELPHARQEADRLSARPDPAHLALADLWHAIGEPGQEAEHAAAACRQALADGEPYVRRYELSRATALLELLGADIPRLPAHDPVNDQPFPLEDQVRAAIREQRSGGRVGQRRGPGSSA